MYRRFFLSLMLVIALVLAQFAVVNPAVTAGGRPAPDTERGDGHGRSWSRPQGSVRGVSPYSPVSAELAGVASNTPRHMRLLVVTATGEEPAYEAATTFLNRIGIPYTTLIAAQAELTAEFLAPPGESTGNFQGVLLTTGNLGYESSPGIWESAFTDSEWQTLWTYEATYGVRQVTFYTFPGSLPEDYGLILAGAADTLATPLQATLTDAGAEVFAQLNRATPIEIEGAWTYLAVTGEGATPLLQTADGYTLAAIKLYPDTRENLALTMDQNKDQWHSLLLNYGVFNWLTRGLFVGERKVYLAVQPDDIMIADDLWDPAALSDATGISYRMTAEDLRSLVAWQRRFSASPLFSGWKIEWPYNGSGASRGDPLTQAIQANQAEFRWINHTWDHMNLDAATYEETSQQLNLNHRLARQIGFSNYERSGLITPDVSGLNNPQAMEAAYNKGIRFVVSDASYAALQSPSPNTGIPNSYQPGILMVPRYATNIFYNTSTPAEQVSEYNHLYRSYWGRDLTYDEILDVESDQFLRYMIRYDINPLMFHQSNSRAYDGTHSLVGDVLDRTAAKYSSFMQLPVLNLSLPEIGRSMQRRMNLNAAAVTAIHFPGNKITLRSNVRVQVPLTGVPHPTASIYGGQPIYWIQLEANTDLDLAVNQ